MFSKLSISFSSKTSKFSRSHLILSMVRLKQGIEHFEEFLDLWKDADPDLPEVDDAKKMFLKTNVFNTF